MSTRDTSGVINTFVIYEISQRNAIYIIFESIYVYAVASVVGKLAQLSSGFGPFVTVLSTIRTQYRSIGIQHRDHRKE
jgi:hypothetical protein